MDCGGAGSASIAHLRFGHPTQPGTTTACCLSDPAALLTSAPLAKALPTTHQHAHHHLHPANHKVAGAPGHKLRLGALHALPEQEAQETFVSSAAKQPGMHDTQLPTSPTQQLLLCVPLQAAP